MRHVSRGFTLIELLVVISIIALLIAILMPALSGARESARSVQCLSNLKQIGVSEQVYENQYGHYTAARVTEAGFPGQDRPGWRTRWEMQLQIGVWGNRAPNANTGPEWAYGSRLSQDAPFDCPEAELMTNQSRSYGHSSFVGLTANPAVALSPVERLGQGNGGESLYAPSLESLAGTFSNADIIMVGDTYVDTTGFSQWLLHHGGHWRELGAIVAQTGFRHPNAVKNALFLDLHAESVPQSQDVDWQVALIR